MKTRMCGALAALIAAATWVAAPAAQAADKTAATIVTVYVSAHSGNGIAKDVNEMHAKMEKEGWKFADLEPHVENGDTEGAWVTYTK